MQARSAKHTSSPQPLFKIKYYALTLKGLSIGRFGLRLDNMNVCSTKLGTDFCSKQTNVAGSPFL